MAAARVAGVAIVLSGAGPDGAPGVTGVKKAGGFIMVPDPAEAGVNFMPQSAIATGAAELWLLLRDWRSVRPKWLVAGSRSAHWICWAQLMISAASRCYGRVRAMISLLISAPR
ncbi:chemotaxis protein CheB [Pararhizobium sp. DWP1-1-3]|uniref:chemotaxis protein CheB n=1 Tax=Pararhizobium sp. DWP1-1-3 TaxID=2804652 RepID=UPI003CF9D1D0